MYIFYAAQVAYFLPAYLVAGWLLGCLFTQSQNTNDVRVRVSALSVTWSMSYGLVRSVDEHCSVMWSLISQMISQDDLQMISNDLKYSMMDYEGEKWTLDRK